MRVAVGDEVAEGDPVAVLEAMKMESTITAPHNGSVIRIAAAAGQRREPGDLSLELAEPVESRRSRDPPR